MYNEYFGFKEAPFSIAPDPRYLYMTAQHREALAHLVFGLNSVGGCILLTGEVGTGKTTICRCLLEQIPEQANVSLLLNPKVNEIELLETICDELHIDYPASDNSVKTYTDRIYQFLIESNRRNEKTVLIIDEAQNLDSKVLEQLRLLTNLETNQRKLLQIIILGQPELLNILARSEMRQLAQRITARFHLKPLDKHEVKAYISHRLAVAGQNIQLFPESSIKLVYKLSKGVPRVINIICDRALLGAYVENQYTVSPSIVKKAATEVFGELKNVEKSEQKKRWLYPVTAVGGAMLIAFLATFYFHIMEQEQDITAVVDVMDTAAKPPSAPVADLLTPADPAASEITETETANNTDDAAAHDADSDTPAVTGTEDNDSTATENITVEYDDIDELLKNASIDPAPAYKALFKLWNKPYKENTGITACRQAEKLSLSCLYRHGNINNLKIHDRPAVLTLKNEQGGKRYITITAIDDESATVFSNDTVYKIKLQDLDRYWYGQFILLWDKPEYYTSIISPGDSGNIINWLHLQLKKLDAEQSPEMVIGRYDDYLADKVKTFQTEQGLTADGIVGPVTIIHLYNQLGTQNPSLTSSSTPSLMEEG